MSATKAELVALRDRHVEYVLRRLEGPEAEAAWRANVAAGVDALLGARIGEVLPAARVADALERMASRAAFDAFVPPISRALVAATVVTIAREPGKVRDHVPGPARDAILRLAGRPGLAPARLVREICAHEAANEIMRDVLSDALAEFQSKINPFAFLKKITPFGLGLGRSLEGFKAEFDKTLEPEMRRFLQGFSARALARFADTLLERWDDASSVALRRSVAEWVFAQPLADGASALSGEAIEDANAAAIDVARAWLTDASRAPRRRALVESALTPLASLTVRDALAWSGAATQVDAELTRALADLTWPAARAAFATPAVQAWFTSLVAGFYDAEGPNEDASKQSGG